MEILKGTNNFLYNTDEKTKTKKKKMRWEVARSSKQDWVFNFQVTYGRHGRIVNGITVGFRVTLVSLRNRKEENHSVYSFFLSCYILSILLLLSRIIPGSCREDRMHLDIGPSPQNVSLKTFYNTYNPEVLGYINIPWRGSYKRDSLAHNLPDQKSQEWGLGRFIFIRHL